MLEIEGRLRLMKARHILGLGCEHIQYAKWNKMFDGRINKHIALGATGQF